MPILEHTKGHRLNTKYFFTSMEVSIWDRYALAPNQAHLHWDLIKAVLSLRPYSMELSRQPVEIADSPLT